MSQTKQKHVPVLAQEVVKYLQPKAGDHYLDLTAGYGGHANLIWKKISSGGTMTLVDRDAEAIDHLKDVFSANKQVTLLHQDFLSSSRKLAEENKRFDIIFADLGISSPHLNNEERGFSFANEGPLDMRMDQSQKLTADEIVNNFAEKEIAKILAEFGEVKNAHKLARLIVEGRPYKTTSELANKIRSRKRTKKRVHPATQVFQAIRIAVNNELSLIEQSLPIWIQLLKTGGRIGVISFHSLEDRLVKQTFNELGGKRYDAILTHVTKQLVTPSREEIVFNPRARSAKLRVAQRK